MKISMTNPLIHLSGRIARFSAIAIALLMACAPPARADEKLWEALNRAGHFAIMRHALAPGTGDPANFQVKDCTTQRNLDDAGRAQARAIGEQFRARGITAAQVYSSQWCRCLETARLLGLGEVTELPPINSFFQDFSRREPQTEALRQWLSSRDLQAPLVLVTHQVNITTFTGVFPSSGEIVVVRRTADGFTTLGTIATDVP